MIFGHLLEILNGVYIALKDNSGIEITLKGKTMPSIPNVRIKVSVEIDDKTAFSHTTEHPLFSSLQKGDKRDDIEKRLAIKRIQEQIYHFISSFEAKKTELALRAKIMRNHWL